MTINQMKNNNILENKESLNEYINSLFYNYNNKIIRFGPANISYYLSEILLGDDENFSAQFWFAIFITISQYFHLKEDTKINVKKLKPIIKTIKKVISELKKSVDYNIVFPHMKNLRKWGSLIINNINDEPTKVVIYAVDKFLYNELKDIMSYRPLKDLLTAESLKIRASVKAYKTFMNEFLKSY